MRRALTAVVLVLTVATLGCGDDRSLQVIAPKTVQPQDVARYPAGSPQRSTLELLRAVQFNDPQAASRYLAPAFGLSRAELLGSLRDLRDGALKLTTPSRLSVQERGRSAATLVTPVGKDRVTLRWARSGGGWRLTGVGARSRELAKTITDVIFLAHHPERGGRSLTPDDPLAREWFSIWYRVRRLGR
jgi:hypothetical protein